MTRPLQSTTRQPAGRAASPAVPTDLAPIPVVAPVGVVAVPGLAHRSPATPATVGQAPAVPVAPVIRRAVTVTNIDYNPDLHRPTHATVELESLWTGIRTGINQSLPGYKNQAKNVVDAVRAADYAAEDVDALTVVIANAIENGYVSKGLAGIRGSRLVLETVVRTSVVAALTPTQMDKGERTAFDALVTNVGEDRMSRAKGRPTPIPIGSLPADLAFEVEACRDEIAQERARWRRDGLTMDNLNEQILCAAVGSRLKNGHYQGNHTNRAGWLPAVPLPVHPAGAIRQAILAKASPTLLAALNQPNPMVAIRNNRLDRIEYEKVHAQALAGYTDREVAGMAIAAVGSGVSAYLEFHLSHQISRLMYDVVNRQFYLTAQLQVEGRVQPVLPGDGAAAGVTVAPPSPALTTPGSGPAPGPRGDHAEKDASRRSKHHSFHDHHEAGRAGSRSGVACRRRTTGRCRERRRPRSG